jgi:hypothetical protein
MAKKPTNPPRWAVASPYWLGLEELILFQNDKTRNKKKLFSFILFGRWRKLPAFLAISQEKATQTGHLLPP